MSSLRTLARPYARAAFELAQADGRLADWSRNLGQAASIVAADSIRALLSSPRLSQDEQVGLVLPTGVEGEALFGSFLGLLAENRRLPLLPEILELFEALRDEAENTLKVRVRAAAALDGAQRERLTAALARRFGKRIELSEQLQPDLLGGAVIEAGGVVIDGSLRGKLARLESALAD